MRLLKSPVVFLIIVIGLLFTIGCNMDVTLPEDGEKEIKELPGNGQKTVNDPYYSDFTEIPGGTPEDYGFTTNNGECVNDHFAITEEGYIDTSPSPGGWDSAAFTPDLGLFDRNENGGVVIEWQVMYPSENCGSFRELNKLYIALVDSEDNLLYRFMYRPLTAPQEQQTVDMEFKLGEIMLAEVRTRTLVSSGAGASWIKFKAELTSTNIKISMDHDGSGYVEWIDVMDDTYSQFRKLHFQYRTGEEPKNYYMLIEGISLYPIE